MSFALPDGESWKVNIGDGSNRVDINTGGTITDNEWHTISVSFNRDSFMKIYLDGSFVEEASITNIGDINVGEGLYFGADIDTGYDFQGAIAEVRIWDSVLIENEIANWYCQTIDNTHPNYNQLLGYWKLNDNTGNTAIDYSINDNDGIIEGAAWGNPSTEEYDYSNTPRIVDIPYTALTHLCIIIEEDWGLDGKSWIPECNIVGVEDNLLEKNITLYPNPINSVLEIQLNELNFENQIILEVLTINGKKIFQKNLTNKKVRIDLSQLSTGIYLLKISDSNSSIVKKIIKS